MLYDCTLMEKKNKKKKKKLINIQPASYNNTQPISSNSEIQTTWNNEQNFINVNNQNNEKIVLTYPL